MRACTPAARWRTWTCRWGPSCQPRAALTAHRRKLSLAASMRLWAEPAARHNRTSSSARFPSRRRDLTRAFLRSGAGTSTASQTSQRPGTRSCAVLSCGWTETWMTLPCTGRSRRWSGNTTSRPSASRVRRQQRSGPYSRPACALSAGSSRWNCGQTRSAIRWSEQSSGPCWRWVRADVRWSGSARCWTPGIAPRWPLPHRTASRSKRLAIHPTRNSRRARCRRAPGAISLRLRPRRTRTRRSRHRGPWLRLRLRLRPRPRPRRRT